MKIVKCSNFDHEHISDVLVEENLTKADAEREAGRLNEKYSGPDAIYFYKVVSDEYKLHIFQP